MWRLITNPGIAPIRMGEAVMKNDHWSIVKTLDLELIKEQLDNNIEEYNNLKGLVFKNSDTRRELFALTLQIESMINLTSDRLGQLLPIYRVRRGLIDPLGSVIKVITGNLDYEDAKRYNSEISNLQNREHSVEKKMSLMKVAVEKLVNVSNDINLNVKHVNFNNNRLNSIVNNQTIIYTSFRLMNSLYQILNNLRTLYQIIYEVETAIAFSKLHTLHRFIINSTELFDILKEVEKHTNLLYKVSKENLVKIENNIEMKTYFQRFQLVFILEIPLVSKEKYTYYKVMPIPILHPKSNKTLIIIPQYPFLMVKSLKFIPVARSCEEIERGRFLCTDDNIVQYTNELCIEQLMLLKSNSSACQQREVEIEQTKIQPITENQWMLYFGEETVITERCGDDIRKSQLHGTYIVARSEHCNLQIGESLISPLTNASAVEVNLPSIQLPDLRYPEDRSLTPIDLRNIDLRDISDVLSQISDVQTDNQSVIITKELSVWTISLFLVFIIVICILCFIYYNRNFRKATVLTLENSSLGEGGVKVANPTEISFVSNINRSN